MSDRGPAGDEPDFDEFAEAYEQHRDALFQKISEYADDEDLADGFVAALILDLAVTMRMVAYGGETEKPSASGLKLDLDRFRKDIDEHVREAKKDAEGFIEQVKATRASAAAEAEDDED